MAVAFTKVGVGPLRLGLPSSWRWRRLLAGGAVDALHVRIEPDVSLEVHVLPGLGTPEGLEQILAMHTRAGERAAAPPPLDLPTGPTTTSALWLPQGDRRLQREVHAFTIAIDLIVALISWDLPSRGWASRATAHEMTRHRSWVELLLRAAVSEAPAPPTPPPMAAPRTIGANMRTQP